MELNILTQENWLKFNSLFNSGYINIGLKLITEMDWFTLTYIEVKNNKMLLFNSGIRLLLFSLYLTM